MTSQILSTSIFLLLNYLFMAILSDHAVPGLHISQGYWCFKVLFISALIIFEKGIDDLKMFFCDKMKLSVHHK